MKSKAPLMLIEQMIMLLVFALAAALCMQAFVQADAASRRCEARDAAVLAAQTAAETLHGIGGGAEQAVAETAALLGMTQDGAAAYTLCCDLDKQSAAGDEPVYTLEIRAVDSGVAGLSKALISAWDANGETLCQFETAWQEAVGYAE